MTHVISIANQKGGVGKSTAVINLAAALALKLVWKNRAKPGRVLVLDMDPQCNTVVTLAGGVFAEDTLPAPEVSLADFLAQRSSRPAFDAILTSHLPVHGGGNLDFMYSEPATMKGVRNELAGSGAADAGFRLVEVVEEVAGEYAYILIDTGPAEDWLTTNALAASTHVIMPIEPAGFSMVGIAENLDYIRKVRQRMNPGLEILGILPSRFHSQYVTQQNILELVDEQHRGLVLPVIAERSSAYDAIQSGMDIFSFKPSRRSGNLVSSDPATVEFARVANDVERRLGG
jgi:chromosome partitioning protein